MRKQRGSLLILVMAALIFLISAGIIANRYLQERVKEQKINSVVTRVNAVITALDDFYLAECYANNGVVAAPSSVNALVSASYLPPGSYANPLGSDFTLAIDRTGMSAVMRVGASFKDVATANRVMKKTPGDLSAVVSGDTVTFSRSTRRFGDVLLGVENSFSSSFIASCG